MGNYATTRGRDHEIFKDFAGPIATIIAAGTAAFITYRFSSRQAQIAKQQADTALDQLRYNVFEKRYAIYAAAKEMVKFFANEAGTEKFDAFKGIEFALTLDEARFFFPDDICRFLRTIQNECQRLLKAHAKRNSSPAAAADHAEWARQGDEIAELTSQLVKFYSAMPAHFEEVLQFPQLTRRGT